MRKHRDQFLNILKNIFKYDSLTVSSMSKTFNKLHIGENFFSLMNVIYKKKKKKKRKKN